MSMSFPWKSMRDYIADQEAAGEVLRIKQPIKCGDPESIVDTGWVGKTRESELRILLRYLQSLPKEPIGIIENPICNRPDIPVVINYWGQLERTLRALGCTTKEELLAKISQLETKHIPPVKIGRAQSPCKEVVITEDKLDLERDLPRLWVEFENTSWFTYGTTILKDEETGNHDLADWRYAYFDWEEGDPSRPHPEDKRKKHAFCTLFWRTARASRGGLQYAKYRKAGKPLPFAIAYGCEPSIYSLGMARLPWPKYDEFAIAGGFRGEPVEVVEAETVPGLYVPAHSEWIIEGEFLPEDYKVPEGAEAVFSGYMVGGELCVVARIKCITHRRNPLWPITWSAMLHSDHETVIDVWYPCEAIRDLRELGYGIKDVALYDMTMAVVQTEIDGVEKNDFPHYGKLLASALYGGKSRHVSGKTLKYIIVVGPDVDPNDPREVLWALNTRVQPVSDSIVIANGLAGWGDVSGQTGLLGWRTFGEQVMIDALMKVPERFTAYPPVSEPKEWQRAGLEQIKRKIEGR